MYGSFSTAKYSVPQSAMVILFRKPRPVGRVAARHSSRQYDMVTFIGRTVRADRVHGTLGPRACIPTAIGRTTRSGKYRTRVPYNNINTAV